MQGLNAVSAFGCNDVRSQELAARHLGDELDEAARVACRERARKIAEVKRHGFDPEALIKRRGFRQADAGDLWIGEHHCGHGGRIVSFAVVIEGVLRRDPRTVSCHIDELVASCDVARRIDFELRGAHAVIDFDATIRQKRDAGFAETKALAIGPAAGTDCSALIVSTRSSATTVRTTLSGVCSIAW